MTDSWLNMAVVALERQAEMLSQLLFFLADFYPDKDQIHYVCYT